MLTSYPRGEAARNGVQLGQFAEQQWNMISKLDRIDAVTSKFSADLVTFIENLPSSTTTYCELDNIVQ